ncbi:hypothetical protein COU87_00780, partial [Candidatus Roizmanbacteria bacterium CG10_big_fil_rev_8_21_14_0_10_39_12]
MKKKYTLSPREFATAVGVSASTVRRWERENVIGSVRNSSGYRLFSVSDIDVAKQHSNSLYKEKVSRGQHQLVTKEDADILGIAGTRIPLTKRHLVTFAIMSVLFALVGFGSNGLLRQRSSIQSKLFDTSRENQYVGSDSFSRRIWFAEVLAAQSDSLKKKILSNVAWEFRGSLENPTITVFGNSEFVGDINADGYNLNLGTGSLTASNVIYSLTAGNGIEITGGQTPTISSTGVTSFEELTGDIDVVAGSNITITKSGNELTFNSSFTDTTYTAGTDLDLSGTEFSLEPILDTVTTINGLTTIAPGGILTIDDTGGLVIPVGTTAQRAGTPTMGTIRYNSSTSQFEGYATASWGSLGSLIDVDQDTYISAENSAGADNDQLRFFTAGFERMFISETGNVGIGTTGQGAYKLNVNGNTNITGNLVVTGDIDSLTGTIVTLDGTTSTYTTANVTTLDLGTNTITDGNLTGNWLATGYVGIGATNPSYALNVVGASNFTTTGTFGGIVTLNSLAASSSNSVLTENSGAIEKRTIDSQVWGTVDLVEGTGATNQVSYWTNTTTQTGSDNFWFDGTNVGIGTTNPGAYKLNVNGNTNITGNLVVTGDVDASTGTITTLDGTTATYTTGNITTLDLGTNTITDGNFTGNWAFNSGNLSGIGTIGSGAITSTGAIQGLSLTDGTATLTGGAFTGLTGITSSGTITFSGLGTGVVQSSSGGVLSNNLGSTNYITKWNASGITNANIYDNAGNVGIGGTAPATVPNLYVGANGNVGIGTTNPGNYKLNVNGTGYYTGALTLGTQASTTAHAVRADRSFTLTSDSNVTITNSGSAQDLTSDRSWTLGWAGLLPLSRGGTGIGTTNPANGALLIGNGTGYAVATLTGTTNQINVTNGSGSITLSTPQDIATTSTPVFAGLG